MFGISIRIFEDRTKQTNWRSKAMVIRWRRSSWRWLWWICWIYHGLFLVCLLLLLFLLHRCCSSTQFVVVVKFIVDSILLLESVSLRNLELGQVFSSQKYFLSLLCVELNYFLLIWFDCDRDSSMKIKHITMETTSKSFFNLNLQHQPSISLQLSQNSFQT